MLVFMTASPLLAAAGLAETARQTAETFGVDWPHFIAQVISFGLVAFLLHRFAYKPILVVLEERRQRIAEGLQNAERIKQEVARTEAERQRILAEANTRANQMIEQARQDAARAGDVERQKAAAEAQDIVTKARQAAENERARMLAELRREIGRLVVQTASRVTGKILTAEDQQRLANDANKELAA
jgi:F-type H+-transporting ATPase subunit b